MASSKIPKWPDRSKNWYEDKYQYVDYKNEFEVYESVFRRVCKCMIVYESISESL